MDIKQVAASLSKLESQILADIITSAGQWHEPLRRIMYLHAVFASVTPHDNGLLERAIRFAVDLSSEDHIRYDQCNAYSHVLYEVKNVLMALANGGHVETALQLCDVAIQEGENGPAHLQDSASWDMALDDLRDWQGSIRQA